MLGVNVPFWFPISMTIHLLFCYYYSEVWFFLNHSYTVMLIFWCFRSVYCPASSMLRGGWGGGGGGNADGHAWKWEFREFYGSQFFLCCQDDWLWYPDTMTVSPVSVTVSPDTMTVSPVSVTVSPDTMTVTPVSVTVSPDTMTVTPVSVTVSPDTMTVSPVSVTVSPDTMTVSRVSVSFSCSVTMTVSPVSVTVSPVSDLNTGSAAFACCPTQSLSSSAPASFTVKLLWSLWYSGYPNTTFNFVFECSLLSPLAFVQNSFPWATC